MVSNSPTENYSPLDRAFTNPTDDNEKFGEMPDSTAWQYFRLCKAMDEIKNKLSSIEESARSNTVTNDKGNIMLSEDYNHLLNEIKDIKTENKITNARIDNTNRIISIVGGLIGLVLTVFIFTSNSQYNTIKDMNNSNMQAIQTEIRAINQRLDYQEKLNSLDIKNQVQTEIKNQKKH